MADDVTFSVTSKGWKQLESNALRTGDALAGTGKKASGTDKALGGLAMRFVGLQAIVTMAIKQFQELKKWVGESIQEFRTFENEMAEVSTILQDQALNVLPKLEAGIKNLSITYGKSSGDLANGLYNILSAAIETKDSINLLNTATRASIAGLTDVSVSVDVFTSILNSYGKSVAQAAQVSDILFQTVIRGKLRFEDLASAMGYITPIAANAGVAFKEIAATLATVTRQGLHVDMATRGLALMLQGIINPANAAATAARKYDIDLSGLALRVKGLTGFITELNNATKEHGLVILPQIVRNMRSLRVAMALAGEEGVQGFTHDLELMNNAAGRTDEAMSKMMNTQQRQAEILAQSMELAERKIGEAWGGIDIWWKKQKMWWATFLSGGDASKAVSNFEQHVLTMKKGYLDLFVTESKLGKKDSFWTRMQDAGTTGMNALIGGMEEFEHYKDYLNVSEQATNLAELTSQLSNASMALESVGEMGKVQHPLTFVLPFHGILGAIDNIREMTTAIPTEDLERLNAVFAKNDMAAIKAGASYKDVANKLKDLATNIEDNEMKLQELSSALQNTEAYANYIRAGFDDASESIENHKTNILELKNALAELEPQVETVYHALLDPMREFKGRLDWELAVKIDEGQLARFEEFASMATQYGNSMKTYTDIYGKLDTELSDSIRTIYEYNKAVKDQKQAEQELQDVLDENLLLIRKNNLEKMKLQLIGMMRRRGNTRSEMKMMKHLDMENLQLRIDNMTKELAVEEQFANDENDIKKAEYEKAKAYFDEYVATERHNLFLLKDTREDDIRDLEETITAKREQYEKYSTWLVEQETALSSEHEIYVAALRATADLMPDIYADMFDTTYMENYMLKYTEFQALTGNEAAQAKIEKLQPYLDDMAWAREHNLSIGADKYNRYTQILNEPIQSLARGTNYVPEEGMYQLHRAEKVVSAGSSAGSGISIGNVTIQVKSLEDISSPEKLAALLSRATDEKIIRGAGKARNNRGGNSYRVI